MKWRAAATSDARAEVWHRMLSIFTQQVFSIGLINGTSQPILRAANLRNVPEKALFGFDPMSYFGVYMPDTFWMSEEG